ncbi:MAG: PAS domain S-box protein [Magnetococcales bacterium]|nr:PAS domain S-box protein [Magnetococcales bacterium]
MTLPEKNKFYKFQKPKRSIRTRMILWFALMFSLLVLTIVGVLTAGFPVLGVQGSLERERFQAFRHLNQIADLKKREIIHWLEERVADIRIIAKDPRLMGMTITLVEGKETSTADIKDLNKFFQQAQDTFGKYGGFQLLDAADGKVLFSMGEEQSENLKNHNLIASALLTPDAVIDDVIGKSKDKPSQFYIAHAILNEEERPVAILVVGIMVDKILPRFLHTGKGLGQTGEALLINERRQILTFLKHSLPDGSKAEPLIYRIQALPARLAALGGEGMVESEDYRGTEVLAAFRHIRLNAEWGWGLVVKIDKAELFAPMKREVRSALLVSLFGITILLLLTFLLSKRLTDPLRHLSNASSRLADGDLTTRSGLRGGDEIGFLGRAFDEMAETIQKSMVLSEAKHRTLVEETTAVVWTTDANGGFINPQDSWAEFTGQPWEQHKGYGWVEMIHPDDRETIKTIWAEALKKCTTYKSEGRVWSAVNEEYRYFLARAVPLLDANGIVLEWIGTISDTTDRKQAEESLQKSNSLLTSIIESPESVIMFALDKSYNYLSYNKAHVRTMKLVYDADIEIGKNILSYIPVDDDRLKAENNYIRVLKGERFVEIQEYGLSNNRSWYELIFNPIINTSKEITGFTVYVTDITERKQLEEKLRQAQKLEAIGTLAGGVAHDFNNILGIISGNAELAALGVSNTHDATKNILEASNRGAELVKQLLTIGRRTQTAKKLLDPEIMINEVLKLMRSTLPTSIEIRDSIKGRGNKVFMDPTHLHQVLINLLSNAGQAMGEDGGELEVTLEPITLSQKESIQINTSHGDYLQLTVRDTGPGISDDIKEHIFEPFFTTKEQGKGTGLGLSVVHSSLKACGGAIQLNSTLGKGSEFIVHLPISEIPNETQSDTINNSTLEKGTGRILFVDDESGLVKIGVDMLKAMGYSAIGETDPHAAIKIFMENPGSFDAIITDQVMPGLAGNELASLILEERPDIPIFLCTGYSEKITEKNGAEIGLKGYFIKPVSMIDLSKALKEAIN